MRSIHESQKSLQVGHHHYSHRTQSLRALLLGINDGLVSVAALLMGIASGSTDSTADNTFFILAGVSAIVSGSLSMACGEFISVAGQRDSEKADIQKEIEEQRKGPLAQQKELEQLTQIYVDRGLTWELASEVAIQLTNKDVIKAHARDEHGIDLDALSGWGHGFANPWQASLFSFVAFIVGGLIPFLFSIWMPSNVTKMIAIVISTCVALVVFGILGAHFGGSSLVKGGTRVFIGGAIALGISYGIGQIFHVTV